MHIKKTFRHVYYQSLHKKSCTPLLPLHWQMLLIGSKFDHARRLMWPVLANSGVIWSQRTRTVQKQRWTFRNKTNASPPRKSGEPGFTPALCVADRSRSDNTGQIKKCITTQLRAGHHHYRRENPDCFSPDDLWPSRLHRCFFSLRMEKLITEKNENKTHLRQLLY